MAKLKRCTFRKQPRETGLSAIANPYPNTKISLNGVWVGDIVAPSRFGGNHWKVGIMALKQEWTHCEDDPCDWSWIRFKRDFDSEEAARAWFIANEEAIREKYPLRLED